MALNRALFQKQLQLGLNTIFGMEYDNYPEQWRDVFSVENSNKAFEEDVQMYGFGAAPVKAEGAAISYDSGAEGIVARYTHETIALVLLLQKKQRKIIFMGHLAQNTLKLLQDQCNTLKKSKV